MVKNDAITEAYKEIMGLKFKKEDTLEEILTMFHDIMRKYDIKQGIQNYDNDGNKTSVSSNTAEWAMCMMAFQKCVDFYFVMAGLTETPKDIFV